MNKKLVVETAFLHFKGDIKNKVYPHTVVVEGLDFRREAFENDADFKSALDRSRVHLQAAMEELHNEKYKVLFDFERK